MSMGVVMKMMLVLSVLVYSNQTLALDWDTYFNARFQFKVDYPTNLIGQGEAGNNDGQVFESQDHLAKLTVFGQNYLSDIKDQCNAVARAKAENSKITYQVKKDGAQIVSGYRTTGKIFYSKLIQLPDTCLFMDLEYPKQNKAQFDSITTRIANSFQSIEWR